MRCGHGQQGLGMGREYRPDSRVSRTGPIGKFDSLSMGDCLMVVFEDHYERLGPIAT
jgi:hypothetical protein